MDEIESAGAGAGDVDMGFAINPALDDLAASRADQTADAAVLVGEVEICRPHADPGGGGQTIGQQGLAEAASLIGVLDGDADLNTVILGIEELKHADDAALPLCRAPHRGSPDR